jgi:hypothetical protein
VFFREDVAEFLTRNIVFANFILEVFFGGGPHSIVRPAHVWRRTRYISVQSQLEAKIDSSQIWKQAFKREVTSGNVSSTT